MDIAGKPMIYHVHALAVASGANRVIIATDDPRIKKAAEDFGATVYITSEHHISGTDRVAEVIQTLKEPDHGIIVNIQGDEPLLPPALVRQVAKDLSDHPHAQVATLCERIADANALFDPAVVKVVMDKKGYALYFSRAPIPWHRDHFANHPHSLPPGAPYYRHIGIYAYRASFLRYYTTCSLCAPEQVESLEQLRVLHDGEKIHLSEARESPGFGVDTLDDLKRAQAAFVALA